MTKALSPPAEVSKFDTGLRFTDILFGFVIRELFLRLQNWGVLDPFVRWQLVASTVLVLGSWIGFRRSLNRSTWEIKFFNLPLARFVLDQLMVILYFRIAVLTPTDPTKAVDSATLVNKTAQTLFFIFVLYALWDLLGIWMAVAREKVWPLSQGGIPWKYPRLDEEKTERTEFQATVDWVALAITAIFLSAFAAFYLLFSPDNVRVSEATTVFIAAAALLLAYRFVKDVKSSLSRPEERAEPVGDQGGAAIPANGVE